MSFFEFLKRIKNRRFVVPALVVLFVVVFSSALFGLAKFGVINLKILGDVVGTSTLEIDVTNSSGQAFGTGVIATARLYGSTTMAATASTVNVTEGSVVKSIVTLSGLKPNTGYTVHFGYPANPNCNADGNFTAGAASTRIRRSQVLTCSGGGGGTYSLDGFVLNASANNNPLPNASITFDADPSKTAVSDAGGHYTLSGLPFDQAQMANHAFTYSALGFQTKASLKLQGDLHQNPYSIQSGGVFKGVGVALSADVPEYKFTGNVKGDNGTYLSDVAIEIVDKNLTGNQVINTPTLSGSRGTYPNDKNYLTPDKITRANLDNLFVQFRPSAIAGYQTQELKLTDTGIIIGTTIAGLGGDIYELRTIKDVVLSRAQKGSFNLQGTIQNPDNDNVKHSHYEQADVRVECKDPSVCGEFGDAKYQLSRLIGETKNGSEENYIFAGLKNIAADGSKITELELRVSKPGYYVDTNNNGRKDVGEDGVFKILPSDILAPSILGDNSVCRKNFILRSLASSEANIYGTVKASDTKNPLAGVVKLSPINPNGSIDTSKEIQVPAGSDGKYSFAGKLNGLDRSKKYWLTAIPKNANYSAEMYSIHLNLDPVINIDFLLEPNVPGAVVFTGYVQNVSADGTIHNIIGADVIASADGLLSDNLLQMAFTTPLTSQYKISLTPSDIFGDNPSDPKDVVLTGFNGPPVSATKHKSYKFKLEPGRGVLIRCDFVFYPTDSADSLPKTKNVEITLKSKSKVYPTISTGPPTLINKSAPAPMANVPVQLISYRSDSQTGTSGIAIRSDAVVTDSAGRARFPGWPMESSKIMVKVDGIIYAADGGKDLFVLPASESLKTINYWKDNWDPTKLQRVAEQIKMQQNDPDWRGDNIDGWPLPTIGQFGCGLTSLAMAVKFYYPTKNDFLNRAGQKTTMTPSVIGRLANQTNSPNLSSACYSDIINAMNQQYGTEISGQSVSIEQANQYLRVGIPVLFHGVGLIKPDGEHHKQHAVLVIGISPSGMYKIINPNTTPAIYEVSLADFGSLDRLCAYTIPKSKGYYFNSVQGRVSSETRALAADGNSIARRDSDYVISANIGSTTVAPVQAVYVVLSKAGYADNYFLASKSGDNYTVTVPKNWIWSDFSYKFLAINAFHGRIESQSYQVKTDTTPITPTVFVARAWSQLKLQVYNLRTNSEFGTTQTLTKLSVVYQWFRDSFTKFLALAQINKSDLVPVSGQVVNASGDRVPRVLVKIWEDAAMSEDGKFTIKNVRKGRVSVSVVDQSSGKDLVVIDPLINISNPVANLKIVVDDPQDVGTLTAPVYGNSDIRDKISDSATLRTGRLQLIRNNRVEKEITLASVAGKINSLALPVGTYSIKYLLDDNSERSVTNLTGGTFRIRKGVTNNDIFKVDDRSTFSIHLTSQNGAADCNVYWWGHMYITDPTGHTADWDKPPTNCTFTFTIKPGTISFRMIDNWLYNRVLTPGYIFIPAFLNGKTYELKL